MAKSYRVRLEAYAIKFDGNGFTSALDEKMQRLTRQAAREWLRTILTRVPIWTGFAQGAIVFAQGANGDLARYLRVAAPIDPVSERPKWYYHNNGVRYAKTPENAGRFGKYSFNFTQHRYSFTFRSDVVYFYINDFFENPVTPSSPWEAIELANMAFKKTLIAGLNELPKIKKFLYKQRLPSIAGID